MTLSAGTEGQGRMGAAHISGAPVLERLRGLLARLARCGSAAGLKEPPACEKTRERADLLVPEGADLVDGGYLDSMGLLDLVSSIEGEFGIRVENNELRHENLGTLRACTHFVCAKLEKGGKRV
jgi:acyl carrier protein